MISSDDFLELAVLPRRIVFIGGGCLSLSFAHVARAAGAAVTILQRGERVMKRFDAKCCCRHRSTTTVLLGCQKLCLGRPVLGRYSTPAQ